MSPQPCPGPSPANQPNQPAAPGTANVCLCNFVGQATKFKVSGIQNNKGTSIEVSVPPYSYIWSPGWAAGDDKLLTVETPYFSKTFAPYLASQVVALFSQ